jgi:hypothetical protein
VPSFFTVMDDLSRGVTWLMSFVIRPNAADEDSEETAGAPRVPPRITEPARPSAPPQPGRIAAE